jgi:hypothetical protein
MTWEDEVRELIDRRQERKKVVEATEREVKELDVEISTLMIMHDRDKFEHREWVASRRQGRTAEKLDARLLVEKGVDADLVKECTTPGNVYEYLDIRKKGQSGARPNVK